MKFAYSKTVIIIAVLLVALILMSISPILRGISAGDIYGYLALFTFDFFILGMLFYISIKFLLPALQNKPALEINSKEMVSYVKNVTIEWTNVQDIELRSGKASCLYITFKWETDYGNYIRVPLDSVAGKNVEIYNNVKTYFEESK